jgi:hypothetical protein
MKYDLILVSGANYKYYNYSLSVLNNITNIIEKNKNLNIMIIFYDLGLLDEQIKNLNNIFHKIIFKKFDFSKYPEHVSLEKYNGKNCTYAWKPIIFYEVCEEYNNLVYWFDTRSNFTNFSNIINIINNNYIYSPVSDGTVKKWTHPTTLIYMNGYKYINCNSRAAGIFGINYNIKWCKDLVTEWKDLALIRECICPDGSDRSNHRQDQSVLTILYYKYYNKYNFKIIDNYIDMSPHYYN